MLGETAEWLEITHGPGTEFTASHLRTDRLDCARLPSPHISLHKPEIQTRASPFAHQSQRHYKLQW